MARPAILGSVRNFSGLATVSTLLRRPEGGELASRQGLQLRDDRVETFAAILIFHLQNTPH
jgi:hypothetical protein